MSDEPIKPIEMWAAIAKARSHQRTRTIITSTLANTREGAERKWCEFWIAPRVDCMEWVTIERVLVKAVHHAAIVESA